ncbi:hypothetical protein LDENG_00243310 [Lucifuga dentata]|nr:hypothetical protein LDENG_00243310 [Lucifuga dentata]
MTAVLLYQAEGNVGAASSRSHTSPLFPPTATLLRQNHFQAAAWCSQSCSSALCVGGGEAQQTEKQPEYSPNNCTFSILKDPTNEPSDSRGRGSKRRGKLFNGTVREAASSETTWLL